MAGVPLWRQQPAKVHVGGQTFQLQNRGILYSHKAAFDLALLTTLTSFPAALPIIYHAPVTLPFLLFLGTSQALSHLGFFFSMEYSSLMSFPRCFLFIAWVLAHFFPLHPIKVLSSMSSEPCLSCSLLFSLTSRVMLESSGISINTAWINEFEKR